MENAQLWQWLKDQGITQEKAARETGYTVNYLNAVLLGRQPLTPAARFRFVETYPETAAFLLPSPVVSSLTANTPGDTPERTLAP